MTNKTVEIKTLAILSTYSSKELGKMAKILKQVVIAPFILCLVGAVPLYLLNLMHIIVHYKNKNWGHPVHSIVSSNTVTIESEALGS